MAAAFDVSKGTVYRAKRWYAEEGLAGVIQDRVQANRYRKLDDKGEAHLIALACSPAPDGHDHWTLHLHEHAPSSFGCRIGQHSHHR